MLGKLQLLAWRKHLRILLSALLASLLLARTADATSCVKPELPTSLSHADVVFVGRAVVESQTGIETWARLAVERVFKGEVPKSVRVHGGGMSGSTFETGKRFLVFAQLADDGQVNAHLCGGTGVVQTEWLKQLGAGRPPKGSRALSGNAKDVDAGVDAASTPDAAPATPTSAQSSTPPESPTETPATAAGAPTAAPASAPTGEPAPAAVPPQGGCGACALANQRVPAASLWLAIAIVGVLRRRRRR